MNNNEAYQAVDSLNMEFFEKYENEQSPFEFISNGTSEGIMFLERCIWCGDDDPREWETDHEEREPLVDWLRKEVQRISNMMLLVWPVVQTEEAGHPEPAEGCTCGFMAQVTDPNCPTCRPNNKSPDAR